MKLSVTMSVLALTMGLSSVAIAAGDYFPPERLHCKPASANTFKCDDFNRGYLVEDVSNVDWSTVKKEIVFNFKTGAAYYTPDQSQAAVFFSYYDSQNRMVKLRTVNYDIKPDLQAGNWVKFKDDIYNCKTGYMSCPITNLPA